MRIVCVLRNRTADNLINYFEAYLSGATVKSDMVNDTDIAELLECMKKSKKQDKDDQEHKDSMKEFNKKLKKAGMSPIKIGGGIDGNN